MTRTDELRALFMEARMNFDNAMFTVQTMPGNPRAKQTLEQAQEVYHARFMAWQDALRDETLAAHAREVR